MPAITRNDIDFCEASGGQIRTVAGDFIAAGFGSSYLVVGVTGSAYNDGVYNAWGFIVASHALIFGTPIFDNAVGHCEAGSPITISNGYAIVEDSATGFVILGDHTSLFIPGRMFAVTNYTSPVNGAYTVDHSEFDSTNTTIYTVETVPGSGDGAGGVLAPLGLLVEVSLEVGLSVRGIPETSPPKITGMSPLRDQTDVPRNQKVGFYLYPSDLVDLATVQVTINGITYTSSDPEFSSEEV